MSIEALLENIQQSKKYRYVASDFIRRVGEHELATQKSLKAAIKSTKNKLHQTTTAYQKSMHYDRWLDMLRESDDRLATCRKILGAHVSTAERLPIIDHFYQTLFEKLPPIESVIDVACGLNPLAAPWMGLAEGARYYAFDIFTDMADFHQQALPLLGLQVTAAAHDVGSSPPSYEAQVALVFKTLPCLEQVNKDASLRLLQGLNAPHLFVSFPVKSIGGKQKGMAAHYHQQFMALIDGQSWQTTRFDFPTELVYWVQK